MGHEQPPTPIKTDNTTAQGFVNKNIHQKRSKAWDMRYHWLRDRANQGQFRVYWEEAEKNNGDYYTKHHPEKHHEDMRGKHVKEPGLARVC